MQLPFTREQFFDLFVAYNEALWPAVVALWIASTVIVARRLSARHQHDRWVSALLVGHWAWSALAYHVAFFTRINPAAWLFAALFLARPFSSSAWASCSGVCRSHRGVTCGLHWRGA